MINKLTIKTIFINSTNPTAKDKLKMMIKMRNTMKAPNKISTFLKITIETALDTKITTLKSNLNSKRSFLIISMNQIASSNQLLLSTIMIKILM